MVQRLPEERSGKIIPLFFIFLLHLYMPRYRIDLTIGGRIMKYLSKVCKNGTKIYEEEVKCDRCGGQGGAEAWKYTGVTCYKCGGTGKMIQRTLEYTPEHAAELEAKRIAKAEKARAQAEAARAEREAEQKRIEEEQARKIREREEAINAQKAISQYVGEIGEKITINVVSEESFEFETQWGWTTCYTFKDADGNTFKWFTKAALGKWDAEGNWVPAMDNYTITAIVKDHSEYKGEKQTVLKNVKVC